jgi:hypothetical protein
MKKLLLTGLTAAMLAGSFLPTEGIAASETTEVTEAAASKTLTNQFVVDAAAQWMQMDSYVQRGGDYQEREYQTFPYNDQTYRYLSNDIDTPKELLRYLNRSLTTDCTVNYILEKRLIIHNGKLAQLEADGGSLLQWDKASAQYKETTDEETIYILTVPIGETGETDIYQVHFKWSWKNGWKISRVPYVPASDN